ncbi:hypothetical protein GCM10027592_20240 [Spirosoma flavus]
MNKLSRAQLDLVAQHIQQAQPHQALQAELIDHLASQIEQRMDQGQAFLTAFEQATQQANVQALVQLKQLYIREFTGQPASATQRKLQSKRRPATKPFQYMLLSSGLTFLILMVFFIVIIWPLAIPINVFQTAWGIGLAGLLGILMVRWWLARRSRRPKSFFIA